MKRRAAVLVTLCALGALTSCGAADGRASDPAGDPTSDAPTVAHPTGADDVILRIGGTPGLTGDDAAFAEQPSLVLTGDGRAVVRVPYHASAGTQIEPMSVLDLDEAQVQEVLGDAQSTGLLAPPPDYSMVGGSASDFGSTEVAIRVDDGTFVHEAEALGSFDSPARERLGAFVSRTEQALATLPSTPFDTGPVELRAASIGPVSAAPADLRVRPWTADDVDLSAAGGEGGCTVVASGHAVSELLTGADQQTFFSQDGKLWDVVARFVLPGDEPCG